jgi:proteasome component ECM29
MEVLTHINKRVKLQPQVKLPTEALLAQYGDTTQSQLVHNFTIMYLETALAKYVDCV